MTLAQRIKDQRTAKGYSQEAVAERLGISRQAVAKWESGQSAPSTENLFRLAELFGTTVDLLLTEAAPPCSAPSSRKPAWRRNLWWALGIIGGYGLLYLLWRTVFSDLKDTSILGWLLTTEPDRHTYLYGWLIHNHLYWGAMALSALAAFFGKERLALCTFAGFCMGLVLGELLGANPAGAPWGYGHYGWQIWGMLFLLSIVEGLLAQKWKHRPRPTAWLLGLSLAAAVVVVLVRASFFQPPV